MEKIHQNSKLNIPKNKMKNKNPKSTIKNPILKISNYNISCHKKFYKITKNKVPIRGDFVDILKFKI